MDTIKKLISVAIGGIWLAACSASATAPSPTAPGLILIPTSGTPLPTIPPASPQALGLQGHLLLAQGTLGIAEFDLQTATFKTLFQPPENGIVNSASLSPDGTQIVLSYSPPPDPNKPQIGYTRLYSMPSDGSKPPEPVPQLQADPGLLFQFPHWSPDGKYLYYGYYFIAENDSTTAGFHLKRLVYPDGKPETVVDSAIFGRLSADGDNLVYVTIDMASGLNDLFVAGADGANPRRVLLQGASWVIDSPLFSPDGASIIFSGVTSQPTSLSDFDRWLGVRVASAHSIPSDLWVVPAGGGQPKKMAHVSDIGLSPDFSPDGKHIAYMSQSGLYVMNPDGSGLVRISDQGALGSLQWIR
jgi:Tol biopolymer transport system component